MRLRNTIIIAVSYTTLLPALASSESDYRDGLNAYQHKDYKTAAQYISRSTQAGNDTPIAYLYLGHAYAGAGDRSRAVQSYSKLIEKFPTSAEGKLGLTCLARIDPAAATRFTSAGSSPPSSSAKSAAAAPTTSLMNRIHIVPATMGHPPVSSSMISLARSTVQSLPSNIYHLLENGGATINLAPNIEDKWPGSGDGAKPNVTDTTMGEEPGRTYDHDVYVYERKKVRGSSALKDPREKSEIQHTLCHELGHAIDDIQNHQSNDRLFTQALNQDIGEMSSENKSQWDYFCAPGEAYAEITGDLLNKETGFSGLAPHAKAFIKEHLRL